MSDEMTRTLKVQLGQRSYPIHIGTGILDRPEILMPHVGGHQVMVVTNDTVGPLYLERLRAALVDVEVHVKVLPDGEQYKTLAVLESIFDALLEVPCDRGTTMIALGGGVVGDIAGFAAACYQRGVPFIQVPTTLLAQVDSSVGGKTAVNHALGKNMIGAFYQPEVVIADIKTLDTLEDRQLHAGLAEIVKYGLIRDLEFFCWLEQHMEQLLGRDADALIAAVERSCRNKAEVVAADERERGERALLNLGHTFGHAIETATGYGTWLHGEAVAAGMVLAAELSQRIGDLGSDDVSRIRRLLRRAQLPLNPPPEMTTAQFRQHMAVDKKVSAGVVRLVLLRAIGRAYVTGDYPPEALEEVLSECGEAA